MYFTSCAGESLLCHHGACSCTVHRELCSPCIIFGLLSAPLSTCPLFCFKFVACILAAASWSIVLSFHLAPYLTHVRLILADRGSTPPPVCDHKQSRHPRCSQCTRKQRKVLWRFPGRARGQTQTVTLLCAPPAQAMEAREGGMAEYGERKSLEWRIREAALHARFGFRA